MNRAIVLPLAAIAIAGIVCGAYATGCGGHDRQQQRLEAVQRFLRGQELIRQGRLVQAEKEFRVCLQVIPEHRDAVSLLVNEILYPQGRTREAAEAFWDAYPHVPGSYRVRLLMLIWAVDSDERAPERLARDIQRMKQAVEVEPVFENRLGLAFNYVTRGDPDDLEEAVPRLQECLQERPESMEARRWLFRCLMEMQFVDQAALLLENLPPPVQNDLEVLRMRARLALAREDRDEAMEVFQRLLEQRPTDSQAHDQLGRFYQQLGKESESNHHFEQAAAAIDMHKQAETLLEELNEFDSSPSFDSAGNCYRMGTITEKMGFLREARAWYQVCLDRRPDHSDAAEALERLGRAVR